MENLMRKKINSKFGHGKYQCSIVRTITQENRSNFKCNEKPETNKNRKSFFHSLDFNQTLE
jgi:hypothetical protein